jgi:hypothetical protein
MDQLQTEIQVGALRSNSDIPSPHFKQNITAKKTHQVARSVDFQTILPCQATPQAKLQVPASIG